MKLPHNPVQAVIAAAEEAEQRRWAEAAVVQLAFRIVPVGASEDSLRRADAEAGFPCAGEAGIAQRQPGMLRAHGPDAAVTAPRRIRRFLAKARRLAHEPRLVAVRPVHHESLGWQWVGEPL